MSDKMQQRLHLSNIKRYMRDDCHILAENCSTLAKHRSRSELPQEEHPDMQRPPTVQLVAIAILSTCSIDAHCRGPPKFSETASCGLTCLETAANALCAFTPCELLAATRTLAAPRNCRVAAMAPTCSAVAPQTLAMPDHGIPSRLRDAARRRLCKLCEDWPRFR